MYAKRIISYFVLVLIIIFELSAADIVQVKNYMYRIDHSKKFILINQNLASINFQLTCSTSLLRLDSLYRVTSEVQAFEVGVKYTVLSPDKIPYVLYFTNLPVINITSKHDISDITTSPATFELVENCGIYSKLSTQISYRGGWSLNLPKKSFRLQFVKDTITNVKQNVRLLNMRKDDDWNLQALANEAIKLNSKVNNVLWSKIHRLAYQDAEPDAKSFVDMEFAELFFNNEYRGLYALSERIDKNQLKLCETQNEIVHGELYKAEDRAEATTFENAPEYNNDTNYWAGFFCKYPESNVNWEPLHDFIDFVINSSDQDFYSKLDMQLDIKNAIDYFIFINVLAAVDNTSKNIYFAKFDCSEPFFIVPWDLDCSMGFNWDGTVRDVVNDIIFNRLFVRMVFNFGPNGFTEKMQKRWKELRLNTITSNVIMGLYQDYYNQLLNEGVYQREEIAWSDYHFDDNHIDYMTDWLNRRLDYLDGFFDNPIPYLMGSGVENVDNDESKLKLRVSSDANELEIISKIDIKNSEIKIYNYSGELALSRILKSEIESVDISQLTTGTYLVIINNHKSFFTRKILINR